MIQIQSRTTKAQLALAAAAALALVGSIRSAKAGDLATVENRVIADLINDAPSAATVNGYTADLKANGSWADVDYGSTASVGWDPVTHLTRLTAMAEAYSDSSNNLYHNASLKSSILSAYNYWISQDPQSSNWFYNEITAPQDLSNVMMLTSGILSSSQVSKGLTLVSRAYESRSDTSGTNTGDNRVLRAMVGINRGIIAGNSSITADAFAAIGDTLVTTSGDGIQRDNSFHQHGAQLYNSGYGSDFVGDVISATSLGAGTQYNFTGSQNHVLIDSLLDGTQWMVRGQVIDYTASGRDITRKNQDTSASSLAGQLKSLIAAGIGYRTSELQAFQTRIKSSNNTGSEDLSLSLSGNRNFWNSDLMVQQRPSYYASVKISSTRTVQPETGNNEGLKNLYLADGVNLIEQTGNEYDNIMPVWNWRRLPGTTVEQDSRSLKPTDDFGVAGTATFAGGVSDGDYGAEAFAYKRFNVQAKKSWFFFDNEFTALGAGINAANSTSEVDTTINQTLLSGTVSYEAASGAVKTLALGDSVSPNGLKWVFHDGVGYFFPTPVDNATISALTKTGTWSSINQRYDDTSVSKKIFVLYLDHGQGFTGGSYNYIVVPGLKVGQMDNYLANNPIKVLSNTASVQAVRQTTLDVTQAAFYSAGSLNLGSGQSLAVSDPSAIMLQRPSKSFQLTASSPSQQAIPLAIKLSDVNFSGSGNNWLDGFTKNATVTLGLPDGSDAGDSVGAAITTDGAANPTIKFTTTNSPTTFSYTSSAALALPGNTTLYAGSNKTLTFNGVISGNASLTKDGDSALNLTGINTYTGGTTVLDGVVSISGDQRSASGGWNIGPNSDQAVAVTFQNDSKIKIAAGNSFNVGNSSPTGTLQQQVFAQGSVVNNGSLTLGRYANLRVTGDWTQVGDIAISGRGDDTFSPVLTVNNGGTFTYTGATPIAINPAPNSTANASLIIGNSDGAGTFTTGQGFQRTVAGAGGASIITLRYGGVLALSNDISQLTTGTLQFSIGDGGGVINTNGFNTALAAPLSNVTDSTGGLTKRGNGTLELLKGGSLSGNTTIANGTLKVSNTSGSATGTGDVTIQSGATLAGNGLISGQVNLQSGGTLSPGNAPGTLSTGSETWSAGGRLRFDVDTVDATQLNQTAYQGGAVGADWLNVSGKLAINGTAANPIEFDVAGLAQSTHAGGAVTNWNQARNYTWVVATASDSISGFSANEFDIDPSTFTDHNIARGAWSVSQSGKNLLLNYRVSTVSLASASAQGSPATVLGGAPKVVDVANGNSGSVRFTSSTASVGAPLLLALDVEGLTDLNAFISHLQAAPGSQGVEISNIAGAAPGWAQQLGDGNWNVLLQFNEGLASSTFAWDLQQDAGATVNQIAVSVPEPTSPSVIGLAGGWFLRRPRRSRRTRI